MTLPGSGSDVVFGTEYIKVRKRSGLPDLKDTIPLASLPRATREGHYWHVPFPDSSTAVSWARQHGLSVDPAVAKFADTLWLRELEAMSMSSAVELPAGVAPREITGMTSTLLKTQEVAVHAATDAWLMNPAQPNKPTHRALLLTDEPGLGKTIISLAALRVKDEESAKTVVICPSSLTANWAAEMVTHFAVGSFTPFIATGQTPTLPPGEADTIIIGWEILAHWRNALISWGPDALVVDEGHYAKAGKQKETKRTRTVKDEDGNPVRDEAGNIVKETYMAIVAGTGSARADAILEIGQTVAKRHGMILALTGTPIVNRPIELVALLELTGILRLWGDATRFQHRHCGPKKVSIGKNKSATTFNGASHLIELATRLRASGHYVRRTKQVLIDTGLMRPKYVDHVYTFDHQSRPRPWMIRASADELAEYRAIVEENTQFFQSRAVEIARDLRLDVHSRAVQNKLAADGASASNLGRIIKQRQEAARVKVPYVIAQTRQLIERGEKVVIAAHHKEIVDAYAEAFTGLMIKGAMGTKKIEHAKKLFNETPVSEHPVLVLSVEAGKTGHTLCKQHLNGAGPACAFMIFAEQIWTPGDEAQAQDRIWRIGQDREVRISNAVLAGTIDEDIYWARVKKRRVVNAAIDAVEDATTLSGASDEKNGNRRIVTALAYGQHRLEV